VEEANSKVEKGENTTQGEETWYRDTWWRVKCVVKGHWVEVRGRTLGRM
jgi:hypothetical protein